MRQTAQESLWEPFVFWLIPGRQLGERERERGRVGERERERYE